MSRVAARDREQVRGPVAVGIAMTFTNLCSYVFVVAAIRWLAPSAYGQVGAMMALLLVAGVVQTGLQASAARTATSSAIASASVRAWSVRSGLRAASILLVCGLLLTPLLSLLLDISGWLTIAFTVIAAAELALIGAITGLMQGRRRWYAFARVQLLAGVGRLLVGGLSVLLWPTATGATFGVAAGTLLPLLASGWFVRRDGGRDVEPVVEVSARASLSLWSVLRDSHLLLALLVLSNLDVLMTRMTLDGHSSGLYAAGLTVTKAVLFLPQFVITVAFPAMVSSRSRRALQITLATVLTVGLMTTVAVAALGPLALEFVGGPQYSAVEGELWGFALLGTVLSLVNVYVFRFLATARRGVEWWLWLAVLAAVVGGSLARSVAGLLTVMITVDLTLLICLMALERRGRHEGTPTEPTPTDSEQSARAV